MYIDVELGRGTLNRVGKARRIREKEALTAMILKERKADQKTILKRIIGMFQDFEKMCFNLSKMDKQNSVKDFKSMSTLAFYTYKHNLSEYLRPKTEE